jgi:acetylornithine deacetylase/succinyl-diaminopimelate desuccinylase-like protein
MQKYLVFLLLGLAMTGLAQDASQLKSQVRHSIDELQEFVAIPNDALESADINRNISWLTKKFSDRGFNTSVLPTEGKPVFFAALPMEDEKPTVLFYMHFDGQSVDPSLWDQASPYEVVLKSPEGDDWKVHSFEDLSEDIDYNWRLFGRSTSDDKGPIVMFLNALDLLKKNAAEIPFNIKVILDGEEEKGSKPLPEAVKQYRELLEADFLLIADGPVHPSAKPTIVYGCRGITTMSITTYGPYKPQHSGHYGNYAPNPGFRLAHLLASMKDPDGRVLIKGYYDGINIDNATAAVLNSVPDDAKAINAQLVIKTPEKVGTNYQESIQYPSLNVRGMGSAWIGDKARTIVPASATAEIDLRLVPETDGTRLKELVKDHIRSEGFYITDTNPTKELRLKHDKIVKVTESGVTDAFRTPLDNAYGNFVADVFSIAFQEEVVKIRIAGGTVPIASFVNELKIPALLIPLVNADNNQHSPNENLKIGQLAYGIKAFYALLSTPLPQ